MNAIIKDFNQHVKSEDNIEDIEIKAERSAEFIRIANEISEFLTTLPISIDDFNKLVGLIVSQVHEAESTVFKQGVELGFHMGQTVKEETDE